MNKHSILFIGLDTHKEFNEVIQKLLLELAFHLFLQACLIILNFGAL